MRILHEISAEIRSVQLFTIMANELGDVFNEEKVVICIRWVDADFQQHEQFIGLKPVTRCNAEKIVDVIKVKQSIQIKVLF